MDTRNAEATYGRMRRIQEEPPVTLSEETIKAIADAVNEGNWMTEYALAVLAVVRFSIAHPDVQIVLQDGLLRIGDNIYGIRHVELRPSDWLQALLGVTS